MKLLNSMPDEEPLDEALDAPMYVISTVCNVELMPHSDQVILHSVVVAFVKPSTSTCLPSILAWKTPAPGPATVFM